MPYGLVYVITNTVNHKLYVGQTTAGLLQRWKWHCKNATRRESSGVLAKAIKKYGRAAFSIEEIEHCGSREELDAAECRWIERLNCKVPNGYNLTDGGLGSCGYRFSPEQIARMSEKQKGRTFSEETRQRMSAARKGTKLSVETKVKMSVARTGCRHSEATKAKMRLSSSGRRPTDEAVRRAADARRGVPLSAEARAAISRRVVAEGVEYSCLKDAASALGVDMVTVSRRIERGVPGYASLGEVRKRKPMTPERITALKAHTARRVRVHEVEYESLTAAADALGMTRSGVAYRLKVGAPGYEFVS